MKIESILRRPGGSIVTLDAVHMIDGEPFKGTKTYHFEPQPDGREIAEVEDEEHIGLFLSIREGYRVAKTASAPAPAIQPPAPPPPPPPPPPAPPPNDKHESGFHVHHVGNGAWAVFDGDERKSAAMTEEEAKAEMQRLYTAAKQAAIAAEQAPADEQSAEQTQAAQVEGGSNHAAGLHIHHVGRGRWAIFDGDERKTGTMTEEEAEAELKKLLAGDSQEG
jgi:type IV secretory pathway VirB10-like protein